MEAFFPSKIHVLCTDETFLSSKNVSGTCLQISLTKEQSKSKVLFELWKCLMNSSWCPSLYPTFVPHSFTCMVQMSPYSYPVPDTCPHERTLYQAYGALTVPRTNMTIPCTGHMSLMTVPIPGICTHVSVPGRIKGHMCTWPLNVEISMNPCCVDCLSDVLGCVGDASGHDSSPTTRPHMRLLDFCRASSRQPLGDAHHSVTWFFFVFFCCILPGATCFSHLSQWRALARRTRATQYIRCMPIMGC